MDVSKDNRVDLSLVFDNEDLTPVFIDFSYGKENFRLKEPIEAAIIKYKDYIYTHSKLTEDGTPDSMGEVAGADAVLVACCLYRVTANGDGSQSETQVNEMWVRRQRPAFVRKVYAKIREIGGLDEEESPEQLEKQIASLTKRLDRLRAKGNPVKNGQSDTPHTSEAQPGSGQPPMNS